MLEAVEIGVQREEVVGVVKRAEQLVPGFEDAAWCRISGCPRVGVGHHVPARGVGAVLGNGLERIHHIALGFGHFVAVFVQHEAVGHHVFERHRVVHHTVAMACRV
jgi:hypothetical protein